MSVEQYELNEKLALLKGWRQDLETPDCWVDPEGLWDKIGIPDWCNDANLTWAEIQRLTCNQFSLYEKAIEFVMERDVQLGKGGWPFRSPYTITPLQEAEALILTLEGLKP